MGVYPNAHPDIRQELIDAIDDLKKGKRKEYSRDVRVKVRGTTDKWKWIHINIIRTRYIPEINDIELTCINYDITQLKDVQEELIEARDEARMMDKLKTAFIANMSHEIRTPLNAIVGFSELLTASDDKEERKSFTSIIESNTKQLIHLVSEILDLSKIEAGNMDYSPVYININDLLGTIVSTYQINMSKDISLKFIPQSKIFNLYSDPRRIRQILNNLIENAIKFTSKGTILVEYELRPSEVEISVEDTGKGIPQDDLDRIFERFVKLDSYVPGTGLGLPICKSLVESIGGKITVTSTLGKGSKFSFTVPQNE